jgi:hypothetical protein
MAQKKRRLDDNADLPDFLQFMIRIRFINLLFGGECGNVTAGFILN